MTSSGASIAARNAAWIAPVRSCLSPSLAFGSRYAATTIPYASLSRSTSTASRLLRPAHCWCASASRPRSSTVTARDFAIPPTIVSSDAPTAPASADAEPPPGVGSGERKAASRSIRVRSVSLGMSVTPAFLRRSHRVS